MDVARIWIWISHCLILVQPSSPSIMKLFNLYEDMQNKTSIADVNEPGLSTQPENYATAAALKSSDSLDSMPTDIKITIDQHKVTDLPGELVIPKHSSGNIVTRFDKKDSYESMDGPQTMGEARTTHGPLTMSAPPTTDQPRTTNDIQTTSGSRRTGELRSTERPRATDGPRIDGPLTTGGPQTDGPFTMSGPPIMDQPWTTGELRITSGTRRTGELRTTGRPRTTDGPRMDGLLTKGGPPIMDQPWTTDELRTTSGSQRTGELRTTGRPRITGGPQTDVPLTTSGPRITDRPQTMNGPRTDRPMGLQKNHRSSAIADEAIKDSHLIELDKLLTSNSESDKLVTGNVVSDKSGTTRTISKHYPLDNVHFKSYMPLNVNSDSAVSNVLERIMILEAEKSQTFQSVAETVHDLLKSVNLKMYTQMYLKQFNRRYRELPQVAADNAIWRKFSRALVESFVLDFCKNYAKSTYNQAYDVAVFRLEDRKGETALQFAVPVTRTADIMKSVVDMPIGIVQSKCKLHMNPWQCEALYLAKLTDEASSCEHIWHHAHVHLMLLKTLGHGNGINDAGDKIINELEPKLKSEQNNNASYLFDFTVRTIRGLKNELKEPLEIKANTFKFVKHLQDQNLLRCLHIDRVL